MPETPQASLARFLADRVLDAHVAALAWLLAESRVPVLVAAPAPLADARRALAAALEPLAAPALRRVRIDAEGHGLEGLTAADTAGTLLVGADIMAAPAPALQVPFKALARGADLVAGIEGSTLEEVLNRLRRLDLRLTEDELTFMGLVGILRPATVAGTPVTRLTALHYVRPLARDPNGHVQRAAPAVLTTWDQVTDSHEDFSWGITAELAGRAGIRPGDLDRELQHRAEYLEGVVAAGVRTPDEVRAAIDGFRLAHKAPGAH